VEEGGDRKVKRIALVLVVLMVVSALLSGCSLLDKVASLKQGFNKAEKKQDPNPAGPTVVIEAPKNATPTVTGDSKKITLYFADATGQKLVAEERVVPKVTGIARLCMEELVKGPTQADLKATLPASTKVLDINVRPDGLAIVDFSGSLIKDLPASATAEKLAVYSIVNTLTQFPTVQKVELRVDGKKVDTLLGYVKVSTALSRNTSLIK
jgi:spore germination protein GerM